MSNGESVHDDRRTACACFRLARENGRTRVFNVDPDLDFQLTPKQAILAMRETQRVCEAQASYFQDEFLKEWNNSTSEQRKVLVCGMVEFLNTILAVIVAVFHVYKQVLYGGNKCDCKIFESELDQFGRCIGSINDLLQSEPYLKILVSIMRLPVFRKYYAFLREEIQSTPPWWLNKKLVESTLRWYEGVYSVPEVSSNTC